MDELARTEARNYLTAAGFFLLGAEFLLNIILLLTDLPMTFPNVDLINGAGIILIAVLLIILRKRDMIAILFTMIGLATLFSGFKTFEFGYVLTAGFILLAALITLTSKDKQKWLLFILPLLGFALYLTGALSNFSIGGELPVWCIVIAALITVISLYYAFACASERICLPGRKLLTADEETDFKASGSVLGYVLFAFTTSSWAVYNLAGETLVPLESLQLLELLCAGMMILVSVLLFAVGKMRFTPVMFLLIAIVILLGNYSAGLMTIGLGVLFLLLGLFAILRKESRILPGIMLILYSVVYFIMGGTGFGLPEIVLGILEIVVAAIAVYLAFVVYSQKKLPKF